MMATVETDWEPVPKYSDLLRDIIEFLGKSYRETFIEKKEPHPTEQTWHYYNISNRDILYAVLLSIAWTVLRHLATAFVFKPLAYRYALTPANARKMPESAWKFVFYLSVWSYTYYVIILSGKYRFFQQPSTMWDNWTLEEPVPGDIYFLYMIQCGYYIHSAYAMLFMDTWRKDLFVTIVHHVLSLILVFLSYSLRYHNFGCLIFLFHDVCDIFLEFGKLSAYFKIQGNAIKRRIDILCNISFFCFTITWFVARLYWFPLKALYSITSGGLRMKSNSPCFLLMYCFLLILQLFHIYWALLILNLWYRVVTGQVVEDNREYDVEERIPKKYLSRNSHNNLQNDIMKSNSNSNEEVDGMRNRAKKAS